MVIWLQGFLGVRQSGSSGPWPLRSGPRKAHLLLAQRFARHASPLTTTLYNSPKRSGDVREVEWNGVLRESWSNDFPRISEASRTAT
jgi:hypothetical protein